MTDRELINYVLDSLKKELKFVSDAQLARTLDTTPNTIYRWRQGMGIDRPLFNLLKLQLDPILTRKPVALAS